MVRTEEIEAITLVMAGTVMFGFLSISIILFYVIYQRRLSKQQNEHQKELLNAVIQAQEKERKRFSEDLHDELGANLSMIKLRVELFEKTSVVEDLSQIKQLLEKALQNTRRVSKALSPAILERYGLPEALQDLAEKFTVNGIMEVNYYNEETTTGILNKTAAIGAFRIIQELINNNIKHGKANKINIYTKNKDDDFEFIIIDNGIKFNIVEKINSSAEVSGLGIKNISSRLTLFNGQIEYKDSEEGNTTKIILKKK
jgi:signal transduction histidine kinase